MKLESVVTEDSVDSHGNSGGDCNDGDGLVNIDSDGDGNVIIVGVVIVLVTKVMVTIEMLSMVTMVMVTIAMVTMVMVTMVMVTMVMVVVTVNNNQGFIVMERRAPAPALNVHA